MSIEIVASGFLPEEALRFFSSSGASKEYWHVGALDPNDNIRFLTAFQ